MVLTSFSKKGQAFGSLERLGSAGEPSYPDKDIYSLFCIPSTSLLCGAPASLPAPAMPLPFSSGLTEFSLHGQFNGKLVRNDSISYFTNLIGFS